jgi:hypothetical protein
MKSEQTECNKEIALMLGWKENSAHKRDQFGYNQCVEGYSTPYRNTLDEQAVEYQYDKNAFAVEDLQFHSDWNWLMEAVEFIDKLNSYFIQIEEKSCYVYDISKFDNSQTNAFIIKDGETKKEAVFTAVSDFAKLYKKKQLI